MEEGVTLPGIAQWRFVKKQEGEGARDVF